MRVLNKNCLIKPDERPAMAGLLHLPATRAHTDLPNTGIIRALDESVPADFKVGQRVMYNRHAQQLYKLRDETLALVKIADVMAVLS
jgi:co-chaperonin GroES (HSP10)